MSSAFWLIALFVSPLLIGWVYERNASWFSAVATVLAACFAAYYFMSCWESSLYAEHRAAIAPFDLDADGVLGELELTKEARHSQSGAPHPHPFDFMVLMVIVVFWNIIGLTIFPAFSRSSANSNTCAEQPQIHGSCPECGNTLGYNAALVGLEGVCPNCNANITFPVPRDPTA
jgi:MFS family permease